MLILWLKVEVVLGEWPRRKRRRREPELFEDDFHGVFECHAEDVGGLRKGDGRGIGVDGGHLVLDAGAGHDDLAAFLAAEFRIEPEEEGEDDEFYLEDLIGFAVEAEETGTPEKFKGTVSDYYDSDVNPLFELEIGGRQVLVPAAEEFIAHIDFEARTMHLVLPEGLLTLE